jgi:4-amino-4-deoxy-L-arabinose transferase-like glycosyltransferase
MESKHRDLSHAEIGLPLSDPSWRTIAALFLAFVAAWTLYGTIAGAAFPIHGDMAQAYAYGREFQLGYDRHPPFWGWIAGAWFLVFPRADWAFDLLAMVNAGIGLIGSWLLIGNFASGDRRRAATLLLLLTPCFTFLAFKYNANSIFLSLWPWALHFFVRSYRTRRAGDAFWFGFVLGLAFLSKYFAVLLAVTCLVAALTQDGRKRYFASAAPYISIAVAALLVAPHLWWLLSSDAPPVKYFISTTGHGFASLGYAAQVAVGSVAFEIVVIALILVATRAAPRDWLAAATAKWRTPRFRMLVTLALLPLLLTILSGLAFRLKISTNMTIGIFSLMPLLLIELADGDRGADDRRLYRLTGAGAILVTLVPLLLSPLIAIGEMRWFHSAENVEPREELAREVSRLWHETVSAPLVYVGGEDHFANSVAFYGPDRPHAFIDLSFSAAPWVTPDALARQGFVAACLTTDQVCLGRAGALAGPNAIRRDVTLSHSFTGSSGLPTHFMLVVSPPAEK